MAEKIKIRDFVVIKKADLELKAINVLIGPQAQGKSLVAKLTYFFRNLNPLFINGLRELTTRQGVQKFIVKDFEAKFPRYIWEGTNFEISYTYDDICVSVVGTKSKRGKTNLAVNISENIWKIYGAKRRAFKKKLEEREEEEFQTKRGGPALSSDIFYDTVLKPWRSDGSYPLFPDAVFIPASRTFFANLQKNIFTFLASNLDIDPFLKDFGKLYENSKRIYKDEYIFERKKEISKGIYNDLYAIVNGDFEYQDGEDWIISKQRKVNLVNASSGQQEAIPMLIVLSTFPFFASPQNRMYFIEEPEAHLFPTSQGRVVSILSQLYNGLGTRFFLTTHSPYILSALNNFILAGDVVTKNKITPEEFSKLNGSGLPLKFEDIAAYTINNGQTSPIVDEEYRLIGGEMLDNISEHFEKVMNKLLDC